MYSERVLKILKEDFVIMDGATGSLLMKNGMPKGVCTEKWILDNPDVLKKVQSEYVNAGSRLILAPTFGANRIRLKEAGLEKEVDIVVKKLVDLSKSIAKEDTIIAGDISMTGLQIEPVGDVTFEELIDVYKEQIKALDKAGVDLLVIETMISLQETRAAIIAVKEVCDLPILVTMTFTNDFTTFYGNTPESVAVVLQSLGVDGIGVNCSVGPEGIAKVINRMSKYSKVPLIAKPNAGMPKTDNGKTYYDMTAKDFSEEMVETIEAGATMLGGCCGTEPIFIEMLSEKVKDIRFKGYKKSDIDTFANSKRVFDVNNDDKSDIYIIEEHVDEMTIDNIKEVIDDNPEKFLVTSTNNPEVLEEILRYYPGRAVYAKKDELSDNILKVINKYGSFLVDKKYTTC